MKVLVTGGAGFIGMHVSLALLERGDQVVIIDNFNDYYAISLKEARAKLLTKATIIRADVADEQAMTRVFSKHKFDKICHLAAQAGVRYSLTNPYVYERSNVLGTLVLLEMARKHNIKDVVFASSSSVYGNNKKVPFSENDPVEMPISFYAATKRADELIAYTYHHLYGLNCTGLRFFTVYGPYGRPDMAPYKFVDAISKGVQIDVYGNGDMQRDFTYVGDIVQGVLAALDKPFAYELFNLGGDHPVSLLNFIASIELALGKNAIKRMLPMQQGDLRVTSADITKARCMLGFDPKVQIDEGMREVVAWYRGYHG